MITILQSLLLGAVQGLTEWLPISSSGHLVLAQKLMGLTIPPAYDFALHIGTLIPVFIIFWKEIVKVLRAFFTLDRKNENFHLGLMIIVASIFTAAIGISFLKFFESLFENIFAVGIGFIVTGIFLFSSKFFKGKKKIGFLDAAIIGIAQGISTAPGISRSGLTISSGLIRKIDKKLIFNFSFLLSIVALVGVQFVEFKNLTFSGIDLTVLFSGVIVAAAVGYASIKILLKTLLSEKFHLFAYYCFAVGLLVLFFFV